MYIVVCITGNVALPLMHMCTCCGGLLCVCVVCCIIAATTHNPTQARPKLHCSQHNCLAPPAAAEHEHHVGYKSHVSVVSLWAVGGRPPWSKDLHVERLTAFNLGGAVLCVSHERWDFCTTRDPQRMCSLLHCGTLAPRAR